MNAPATDEGRPTLGELNAALACELRLLRDERQVAVTDLVEPTGMHRYTLQRIFKGEKTISHAELLALAPHLNINLTELNTRILQRTAE